MTTEEQKKFIFSLDLGQVNDYTALIILERTQKVTTETVVTTSDPIVTGRDWREKTTVCDAVYAVRYIERMRNLPYPVIVDRVKSVIEKPEIEGRYKLVIDQSGVGRPVYDMFHKAGLDCFGITITGGGSDQLVSRSEAHVAKQNLVAVTQVISQSKDPVRLNYAAGLADLELLRGEVGTFGVQRTKAANEIYEAREGAHDDLILALALGLWFGEKYGNPQRKAYSHQG